MNSGTPSPRSLENLHEAFSNAKSRYGKASGYSVKQFSDSIILSAPFASVSADDFLREVAELQILMLQKGILTRGGVAVGKHFEDDDFVASQAVIDAYEVEQSISKFPRVVVPDNFLSLCYPSSDYSNTPLVSFIDGAISVDYMRHNDNLEITRDSLILIWANSGSLVWSAREKIYWLVEYWNHRQPTLKIDLPDRFAFF